MAKRTKTPNYIKIAIDIANRVLNNDFKEGSAKREISYDPMILIKY